MIDRKSRLKETYNHELTEVYLGQEKKSYDNNNAIIENKLKSLIFLASVFFLFSFMIKIMSYNFA